MLNLLVIQTGGTIDKEYPRSIGGYAFEIGEPAAKRVLECANPSMEIQYETVCCKDSQDIDDADRQILVDCLRKTDHDKILITHGTDTMIETAQFLSDKVKNKTVLLCGALKPEAFKNSNADFNIGCAIGALNVLQGGVYTAMSGRVYAWDSITRDISTGQFITK